MNIKNIYIKNYVNEINSSKESCLVFYCIQTLLAIYVDGQKATKSFK